MSVQYNYDPRDFNNLQRDARPQHYDFQAAYRQDPRWVDQDAPAEPVQPRGYIEEPLPRERAQSRGPRNQRGQSRRRYDDESDADDDDDWDFQYRRYRGKPTRSKSRPRARSVDAGRDMRASNNRDIGGGKLVRYDSRRRPFDSETETDTEDEAYQSDARSGRSGRSNSRAMIKPVDARARPCSYACPDNAMRPRQGGGGFFQAPESDSEYDSEEAERSHRDRRKKRIAYGALAGLSTLNAANTLFQNSRGFKARREAVNRGEMCSAEAKLQKRKMLADDALALLVMGLSTNGAIKGWKKSANAKEEDQQVREKWDRKRERRNSRMQEVEDVAGRIGDRLRSRSRSRAGGERRRRYSERY